MMKSARKYTQATEAIASLLTGEVGLASLEISGDSSRYLKQYLRPIIQSLQSSERIQRLDISDNQAGDGIAEPLRDVLLGSTTLRELYIDGNHLTLFGFTVVALGMEKNPSVIVMPPPMKDYKRAKALLNQEKLEQILSSLTTIKNAVERNLDASKAYHDDLLSIHDPGMDPMDVTHPFGGGTDFLTSPEDVVIETVQPISLIESSGHEEEPGRQEPLVNLIKRTSDKPPGAIAGIAEIVGAEEAVPMIKQDIGVEQSAKITDGSIGLKGDMTDSARQDFGVIRRIEPMTKKGHPIEEGKGFPKQPLREENFESPAIDPTQGSPGSGQGLSGEPSQEGYPEVPGHDIGPEAFQVEGTKAEATNESNSLILEMQRRIFLLQRAAGLSDEELEWTMQSNSGNAYLLAEEHFKQAELEYDKAMYEQSRYERLLFRVNNINIIKALEVASKAQIEVPQDNPQPGQAEESSLKDTQGSQKLPAKSLFAGSLLRKVKPPPVTIDASRKKICKLKELEESELGESGDMDPDYRLVLGGLSALLNSPDSEYHSKAQEVLQGLKNAKKAFQSQEKVYASEKALQDIELWSKRMLGAPEREKVLEERKRAWAQRNHELNKTALKAMRTYIPLDIASISVAVLKSRAEEAGSYYPQAFASYLKSKKLLWWVVQHADDISNANFLQGADAIQFKNLHEYDIIELRAVAASLPEKFKFDTTGAKAAWRLQLLEKLESLIQHEETVEISSGWDPVAQRRRVRKLDPLPIDKMRNRIYFYLGPQDIASYRSKLDHLKKKLDTQRQRFDALTGGEDRAGRGLIGEARDEKDAIIADCRNGYLQAKYGKCFRALMCGSRIGP